MEEGVSEFGNIVAIILLILSIIFATAFGIAAFRDGEMNMNDD